MASMLAENMTIIWAAMLIAGAILLFFIELFVPSAGLFGVMAATALVGGIVMLFYHDSTLGLIGTTASLVAVPCLIGIGFKILPNTPVFRRLTLSARPHTVAPTAGVQGEDLKGIAIGDLGTALTELRPVGTCRIKGKRIDCLAEHGIIKAGTAVRVAWSDGMQVKVRPQDT